MCGQSGGRDECCCSAGFPLSSFDSVYGPSPWNSACLHSGQAPPSVSLLWKHPHRARLRWKRSIEPHVTLWELLNFIVQAPWKKQLKESWASFGSEFRILSITERKAWQKDPRSLQLQSGCRTSWPLVLSQHLSRRSDSTSGGGSWQSSIQAWTTTVRIRIIPHRCAWSLVF